ncbi:biotin--[acetyl-CoA-carboxylase] ligase [Kiritimatiella glycovorans]|uniref:Bifunctional protein BirA n=1 Tax=Kiritimatiella glycovorans TaxID=1307763 RepID=A0A0G3EC62_9BACT|nr:biotin--[acetyl-CoA-carboxylase] ligase [Kiritimatiella glycovorans]AKJ64091.1 Bifunctional protein BirA [Kiritimatiella glycovorans]
MGWTVEWIPRVDSTNRELRRRVARGRGVGDRTVLAAREQTAGRGRHDRVWHAVPGRDLTCSLFVRTKAPPTRMPSLGMAAAAGVARFVEDLGVEAGLKWPNDVLARGHKLAGLLTVSAGGAAGGAVIGLGLNVNMTRAGAEAIDQPATSLRIELGREIPVEPLLDDLLRTAGPEIDRWRERGFNAVRATWERLGQPPGASLCRLDSGAGETGTFAGFGADGQLLLRDGDRLREVWSGEWGEPTDAGFARNPGGWKSSGQRSDDSRKGRDPRSGKSS